MEFISPSAVISVSYPVLYVPGFSSLQDSTATEVREEACVYSALVQVGYQRWGSGEFVHLYGKTEAVADTQDVSKLREAAPRITAKSQEQDLTCRG